MAMNPERKADWLTRLRSGGYRQGRDELKSVSDGSYCCLGVACDAAVQAGVAVEWQTNEYTLFGSEETDYDPYNTDVSWSTLPPGVQEWMGLEDGDPYVRIPADHPKAEYIDTSRERLSALNDAGFTFEELADLIESQL